MSETQPPEAFDEAYRGIPPWDIGRPQYAVVRLAESGFFSGRVIDVGCGTGDNALFLAAGGLEVTGIDVSPRAITTARAKAAEQGVAADFAVGDALELSGDTFDVALDSGVFHVFSDADRVSYCTAVGRVVRSGGRLALVCFSENEPGDWGPRRVTQHELRASFAAEWEIDSITPVPFGTLRPDGDVAAWLMTATRR